jgi:predicted nucleotidyltransferase/uncharacterized protein (UPF0332 family)
MTNKKKTEKTQKKDYVNNSQQKTEQNELINNLTKNLPADLPKESKEKLEHIQKVLGEFQKKIVARFQGHILGISLLPPNQETKEKKLTQEQKDAINVLILLDDADSKKLSKEELKEKLNKKFSEIAKEIDKNFNIETLLITEVWQTASDGKTEILQKIAMSAPVFDRGMMSAIKIAEIHKQMVLEKFENYIVSYVLAGSLVQGKATPKSDIDVFIVIDDTDVKKMSRAELKDKLRAIIVGMGIDAGNMTGIKNKLNIQVYILTDFWDSIKEANPVIFTFLRDGIPFYDRGIFMPWKQLLKMGKVKPSPEAIDMYMHSGDQMLERVKVKLKEIGTEDFFWATLTPSQAALMMMGIAPPTPKESPKVMKDVFVKKEKLLEPEYVKILEKIIKLRKDIEHGEKLQVSGKELDSLYKDAEKYLKRLKKLFNQISELKQENVVINSHDSLVSLMRDIIKLEKDIKTVPKKGILEKFKKEIVHTGCIPERIFSLIKTVFKTKINYDSKKHTNSEINNAVKDGKEAIKYLIEYIERKRTKELDKVKLKVKHGKKYGEVIILKNKVFIIHDVQTRDRVTTAKINKQGRFENYQDSNLEELEKAMMTTNIPKTSFIKEKIFEDLKEIFGKNIEIMLN